MGGSLEKFGLSMCITYVLVASCMGGSLEKRFISAIVIDCRILYGCVEDRKPTLAYAQTLFYIESYNAWIE
ncbi:hypothetical protein GCM10011409_31780 [Lentibacillus populi]|uniref:Uncharacterized protein n=1 Tax=Lentibacillus populi TaxID=1827502 RepID=A0A9W5X6G8_9BACI|nr:hypothetical protein GCM10011409_31780 [Lentibacillus populi]